MQTVSKVAKCSAAVPSEQWQLFGKAAVWFCVLSAECRSRTWPSAAAIIIIITAIYSAGALLACSHV
jgi:hypothetical protein